MLRYRCCHVKSFDLSSTTCRKPVSLFNSNQNTFLSAKRHTNEDEQSVDECELFMSEIWDVCIFVYVIYANKSQIIGDTNSDKASLLSISVDTIN